MNVFIVGGTSGIGLSLAKYYADQNHRVGLCGRNPEKLPSEFLSDYDSIEVFQCDATNKEKLDKTLGNFSKEGLDLCFFSAGVYTNSRKADLTLDQSLEMIDVNILGLCNTFDVAKNKMIPNGHGHLAAISSVAGLFDDPGASLYSKTKQSIIKIAEAYDLALKPQGIDVTVLAPGYVSTDKLKELNNNDISNKPFVISTEEAVKEIDFALTHKMFLHTFPWQMRWVKALLQLLPKRLQNLILSNRK